MSSSGTLIVIGSDVEELAKSVESYNPDLDEWKKVLSLDVDRIRFRSIMLEEKLMLVGGYDKAESPTSYDFPTGILTTLAPMKNPRFVHGVAVESDQLYAIGGLNGNYLNSVERYNPLTEEWTDMEPMPTARGYFGIVVNDGEIYVIGGFNGDRLSIVESYNPEKGSWKTCASMNDIRDEPGVVSIDNFIYAIGGYNGSSVLNTIERYESTVDKWTYVQTMTVSRHMIEVAYYNNSMIVAGGYGPTAFVTDLVESFDGEWTTLAPMLSPRAYFSLVEVPWKFK